MTGERLSFPTHGIVRVDALRLAVTEAPWPLAERNADAIRRHFDHRKAANPAFFDGSVFVLRDIWLDGTGVAASLSLERFSSFLYWRDGEAQDDTTLDGFGSALVLSADGHVLAIEASQGTLNAGRVYLPGGFIDARDVGSDGTIAIDASIERELREETGLDKRDLYRQPGYRVVRQGRHCCFCATFRSPLATQALRERMLDGAAGDVDREIADVIVIRNLDDLTRHHVLDHARLLISDTLATPYPP